MTVTAIERRRATLVSADAAGYSRLMAVDELATIQAIKVFREAAEQIAGEHDGRLVDSPGDNLLFEFGSAVSALDASLRFQTFVLETNERLLARGQDAVPDGNAQRRGRRGQRPDLRLRDQHRRPSRAPCPTGRHLYLRARSNGARGHPATRGHRPAVRQEHPAPDPRVLRGRAKARSCPPGRRQLLLARDRGPAVRDGRGRRRRGVPRRRHDGGPHHEPRDVAPVPGDRAQLDIHVQGPDRRPGPRRHGTRGRVPRRGEPAETRRAGTDLRAAARRREWQAHLGGPLEHDDRRRVRHRGRDRAGHLRRAAARARSGACRNARCARLPAT